MDFMNKKINRLKLVLETSTSCVGTCVGCALPVVERLQQKPIIEKENLQKYFQKIEEFIWNLEKKTEKIFDFLIVELVVGEHFNYSQEYLNIFFQEIHQFFQKINKKYILAISTSGLVAKNKVEEKLKILHRFFDKEQLEVHLVCNLNKFNQYEKTYREMTKLFQKYFKYINILTNFDNQLPTQYCDQFAKYLQDFEITDFQLVYGLKQHNQDDVNYNPNLFYEIYHKILQYAPSGYRQRDVQEEIEKFENNTDKSIQEMIVNVDNIVENQLFINSFGDVFNLIQTMFGGIELETRAGFQKITNIFDNEAINTYLNSKKIMKKTLTKKYLSQEVCQKCLYKERCYNVALPILSENFIHEGICYNPVIPFYKNKEHLISIYQEKNKNNFLKDWKIDL
jgi:hypothetical protein